MPLPILGAAALAPWIQALLGAGAVAGGGAIGSQISPWISPQQKIPKPAEPTPEAKRIAGAVEAAGGLEPYRTAKEAEAAEKRLRDLMIEAQEKATERAEVGWNIPIPEGAVEGAVTTLPTGATGRWLRDPETGYPMWNELTPASKAPTTYEPYGTSPYGDGQFNPYTGQWEPTAGYVSPSQQQQFALQQQQYGQEAQWQQQQLGFQQQQLQSQEEQWRAQLASTEQWQQGQLEAQREQQLASLRAQPASWLEYASLAGEQPVVQPWMMPLSYPEYGFEIGEPIPSYQPTDGMNLAELQAPSAQYLARMSPTARQQYAGYEQARTGETPADIEQRLWSQAPPGGTFRGLRYTR